MDTLQEKGRVETLIRLLSRPSEQALLIISGKSDPGVTLKKIGPVLIFEQLWQEIGIEDAIARVIQGRRFAFNVERAIFLSVLRRLMVSRYDRFCHRWRRDYLIDGVADLDLHHLYRFMASLRTCPHGKEDRVLLSGTMLRMMLSEGGELPDHFGRDEVVALIERLSSLPQIQDSRRGTIVN